MGILSQIIQTKVRTYEDGISQPRQDAVAVEEPLEIRLDYGPETQRTIRPLSVTMRTPGCEADLAVGFLLTEGIVGQRADILRVQEDPNGNSVVVSLRAGLSPALQSVDRNFYTTSSCGVCGKSSIDAVRLASRPVDGQLKVSTVTILTMPELLRQSQQAFEQTGGLHAAGLFAADGKLLLSREDVGRHNAVDKLIGASTESMVLPLSQAVLCLSGRISFELVQKAAMAGIPVVVAVGSPSSLAIRLAEEQGITVCGFVRGKRFNVYCGDAIVF